MRRPGPVAEPVQVKEPRPETPKKYGLSMDDWRGILERQGGCCYVCRRVPSSGRLCIDHEHVRGWKRLPPEERRLYVRGLLCFRCNSTFVSRGMTVERAQNIVLYLSEYLARRPAA